MSDGREFYELRIPGNYPLLPRDEQTGLNYVEKADFDRSFMPHEIEIGNRLTSATDAFGKAVVAAMLFGDYVTQFPLDGKIRDQGLPIQLAGKIPVIYQEAFLFAAENVVQILDTLTDDDFVPEPMKEACRAAGEIFPDLKGLRDTAHHKEDRIRWKREGGKDLKTVGNEGMYLEQSAGLTYGATMANGRRGSIEVSAQSVMKLRDAIQKVIDSIEWQGPAERFYPIR